MSHWTTESERSLLQRAKTYDVDALAEIYDHYEAKIYSYIYHRVGNPLVAQDLTSQVFLRVLEAIRHQRMWESSFSGWLYRIAHNLVVDHYRSRKVQLALDDLPLLPAREACPEQAAQQTLAAEQLRAAINRLTEEQAQVVTLRFLEDLSITEVAQALGKTEGAIKAMQYRAVMSLRRILDYHEL